MKRREAGFSTLEVIAAVAIVAIALLPIAALQTQLARSQGRLAEAHAETTSAQSALALLRDINPMLTPTGERRLDDRTTLVWTSAPASDLRRSITPAGFEVQLYRIHAQVRGAGAATELQLDLIGWRKISDDTATE